MAEDGRRPPRRQSVRRLALMVTFVLFPVVLNYLSPYIIVDAAARGVVNGSLIVFASLLVLSLLVGRAWCGWACPAAGIQEFCFGVSEKPAARRGDVAKWVIWSPWIVLIAVLAARAGGYTRVDPLYLTEKGISIVEPLSYVTYYFVLALILVPCLLGGRRAFCHYICWMAPFMILGRKLRDLGGWAALRLSGDRERCTRCGLCARSCPMSLPVTDMVQSQRVEHAECILCGTCVDVCPQGAIRFQYGAGRD
jgi:ferredoxin-type protein NapH